MNTKGKEKKRIQKIILTFIYCLNIDPTRGDGYCGLMVSGRQGGLSNNIDNTKTQTG
jgi:hypothetical protein